MNYEDIIYALRLCGSTPSIEQCKKCAYWNDGDIYKCVPKMTQDAASAIEEKLLVVVY